MLQFILILGVTREIIVFNSTKLLDPSKIAPINLHNFASSHYSRLGNNLRASKSKARKMIC